MEKEKLFKKDFTLVVIGQIISLFGNAILRFALPLCLLRETGSAALFGAVSACSFLPMIVMSLLGGVMADRLNKRNIMVVLDFLTAAIITLFYFALGQLPIVPLFIVVLMLLYGISGTYQPAVQASIPVLVSGKNILPANAIINQISSLAALLGPIIGGVLYSSWGINLILIISTICFTISAIMEIFIEIPFTKRKSTKRMLATVKDDLSESLHYMKKEKPVLLKTVPLIAFFNLFFSSMLTIGMPVILVEALGIGDKLFGISQGAMGIGGLAGGVLVAMFGKKLTIKKSHYVLLGCALLSIPMGFSMFLNLPIMISYTVITVSFFLCMALATMFTITILSAVQMQTPPQLVGKVISCLMAFAMCSQPIGQAMYGFLFEKLRGAEWSVILFSIIITLFIGIYSKKIFAQYEE